MTASPPNTFSGTGCDTVWEWTDTTASSSPKARSFLIGSINALFLPCVMNTLLSRASGFVFRAATGFGVARGVTVGVGPEASSCVSSSAASPGLSFGALAPCRSTYFRSLMSCRNPTDSAPSNINFSASAVRSCGTPMSARTFWAMLSFGTGALSYL